MKRPISFALPIALALSIAGPALADELVITLRSGRTIVLDTSEISSMIFTKGGETVQLVPSPKRFSRGTRPPGTASATFRSVQDRGGNVALSVTLTNVQPNHRFDVHLFVDGRHHLGRTVGSPITDATGCAHFSCAVQLAPGERVLALSITEHNSEADIYVTPDIYQNGGTTVRVPLRGPGDPRRPRP